MYRVERALLHSAIGRAVRSSCRQGIRPMLPGPTTLPEPPPRELEGDNDRTEPNWKRAGEVEIPLTGTRVTACGGGTALAGIETEAPPCTTFGDNGTMSALRGERGGPFVTIMFGTCCRLAGETDRVRVSRELSLASGTR